MGDTQHQPGAPFSQLDAPAASASFLVSSATGQPQIPVGSPGSYRPTPALALGPQQSQQQQQHQQYDPLHGPPQHAFTSQLDMAQPQSPPRVGPFDMSTMANTLPRPNYRPGPGGPYGRGQQRYHPMPNPSPAMVAQLPTSPFAGQGTVAMIPNQHQHQHQQQYYLPQQHAPMAHYYPNGIVVGQQPHPGAQYYYPQTAHFAAQPPPNQPQLVSSQYVPPVLHQVDPRFLPSHATGQAVNMGFVADQNSTAGLPSIVRGPPRKPRQSGHAIWIGNLPPQTDLMSLVHHVCRETDGLESLFLISKSNCAFANFKDEKACIAAQKQLHDSKFQSVRLVSRLRKSTVESAAGVTAPTGPAGSTPPAASVQESDTSNTWEGQGDEHSTGGPAADESKITTAQPAGGGPAPRDRFFILKSLTVEDLELSVRTGIWATQSHNEESLNSAFASSDNVYLVFSANKSGEYFGFARMTSSIDDDPAAAIQFAPAAPTSSDVELPKAIPTNPTEFAPKGRIIDDSARGTIFWEVEREDRASGGSSNGDEGPAGGDTGSVRSGDEDIGAGAGADTKPWGKPFRLEWLSTVRLPFYRTRGLRNPWNSNREVKIARDGTELQPAVGRRLIGLFNRVQSPVPHVSGIQGSAVPTVGIPPMRPPY